MTAQSRLPNIDWYRPKPAGRGRRLFTPRQIAAALLVCAAPASVIAKPIGQFTFVVETAGDQVDPSIDGEYVVYAGPGPAGEAVDVFLHDVLGGTTEVVGGGAGDQDSPDVHRDAAVYRTPEGILIEFWQTDGISRAPPPGGEGPVSNPVIHTRVAAWEHHNGTDQDVVVTRYRGGSLPYVLRSPGDLPPVGGQHAPAVFDDLVAYVDDALGGGVWLHDSAAGERNWSQICAGEATGVSLGREGSDYVLAVARGSAGAEDIEVYDVAGDLLASLPAAGPQRNPHLAGSWVAFEDYSTAYSQVVLWRWKTPAGEPELVFVPRPSLTQQRLNDVTLSGTDEVRVVFEDSASSATGRDIGLYRLPIGPIQDDGEPGGWPIGATPAAGCQDPTAVVLATLELERGEGKPQEGSASFTVDPPRGEDELPVLVCIHAEHVSAACVALDGEAVATPSDFDPHVVDLAISSEVEGGRRRISGAIAGKPGARLVVRVLADPNREDDACLDDDHDDRDRDDHDRDHRRDRERDHDRDRDRDRDRDGDGDHDRGRDHRGGDRDDEDDDEPGHEDRVCRLEDLEADTASATVSGPYGGGCGSSGGLSSLAALGLLLARRKPRG